MINFLIKKTDSNSSMEDFVEIVKKKLDVIEEEIDRINQNILSGGYFCNKHKKNLSDLQNAYNELHNKYNLYSKYKLLDKIKAINEIYKNSITRIRKIIDIKAYRVNSLISNIKFILNETKFKIEKIELKNLLTTENEKGILKNLNNSYQNTLKQSQTMSKYFTKTSNSNYSNSHSNNYFRQRISNV